MPEPDHDMTARLLATLATQKEPDLAEAVEAAITNDGFRRQLLDGLASKNDVFRYNSFKVLQEASELQPASLYPHWDEIVLLLDSPNAYHRSTAVRLLANLTQADRDRKFESLRDRYFDLLDDEKIITARYLVGVVSTIVQSYPNLAPHITDELLSVDRTHHAEGRKDLLKGDIIEAFDTFFTQVPDRTKVLSFVEAQQQSSSPRTRKAARAFLEKHSQ